MTRTIEISFPQTSPETSPETSPQTSPTTQALSNAIPTRILFVDDDPDIHTSISLQMQPYLADVRSAYFGMQGIVESTRERPDLIVVDLSMPNGDGEYLLECVKRHPATRSTPVIVLTGNRNPSLPKKLMRAGADAVLHKPLGFDKLVQSIRTFVPLPLREPEEL